MSMIRIKDASL